MNKGDLASFVSEILDWPKMSHRLQHGKGTLVVNAVFATIAEALQRGESVRIVGLGTFLVRTRPARLRRQTFFRDKKEIYSEIVKVPAKRYVHFRPARTILPQELQ